MVHWAARKVMEAALQSCYMGVRSWGTRCLKFDIQVIRLIRHDMT